MHNMQSSIHAFLAITFCSVAVI